MLEGRKDLLMLFREQMTEENFKDCIHRSFVKTGTYPKHRDSSDEPAIFVQYKKEQLCGTLTVVPEGTINISVDEEEKDSIDLNDIEYLERAILEHYALNNDIIEISDNIDDSDDENDN